MVEYKVILTWASRVRITRRYLASPGLWPDGIDTKYERWYLGHEAEWAALVQHLDEHGDWKGGLDDEAAYGRFFVKPVDVTKPDVTERVTKPMTGGRPPLGDEAMSAAERKRRERARKKAER